MIVYLIVFAISSICIYISEKIKNKYLQKLLVVSSILLTAVLAGLRAESVGTDVEVYAIKHFNNARASDSFLSYFANAGTLEILYYYCVYIASRLSTDYHLALFFIQLVINCFMYLGIARCNRCFGTQKWLAMTLVNLLLFNMSLNTMRQSMAIAVVFYSVTFIFDSKYMKHYIWLLISAGFHSSALVGIMFLPIYLLVREKRNVKIQKQIFQCGILFVCGIWGIVVAKDVALWMIDRGYFRKNYLRYLDLGNTDAGFFSVALVLMYGIYILFNLIHYEYMKYKTKEWLFFMIVTIVLFISKLGTIISTYLPRVGYYCIPIMVVGLTNLRFSYSNKSAKCWDFMIIVYTLVIWYITFVYWGSHETIPYQMSIFTR